MKMLVAGHLGNRFLAALMFTATTAIGSQAPSQNTDIPPYHVDSKIAELHIFADGIVSTPNDEIGGAFSPDGTDFYFTQLVPYTTLPRLGLLCGMHYPDGHWSTPEAVPFSGQYLDYPPKFDSSGKAEPSESGRSRKHPRGFGAGQSLSFLRSTPLGVP